MKLNLLNPESTLKNRGYSLIIFTLLFILISFSGSSSYSKTIYVDIGRTDNNSDGSSWVNAKKTINSALDSAIPGDNIWVKKGTYIETIIMKSGVELYGGFAGYEISTAERSDKNQRSVIDASKIYNNLHVVFYNNISDSRLDGFKITGGKARGVYPDSSGGGILCRNYTDNTNTIANCEITSNTAENSGGGIACSIVSSPLITDCIISGNFSESGGGIYFTQDSTSVFSNNKVVGNKSIGIGAGIASILNSHPVIKDCIISGNYGHSGSACAFFDTSDFTLTNTIISGNDSYYGRAAVYSYNAYGKIMSCIISGNQGRSGCGGIAFYRASSPMIINNIITDNPGLSIQELDEESDPIMINNALGGKTPFDYYDVDLRKKLDAAGVNKLSGNSGNINADTKFVMDSKYAVTGKWTSPPVYDAEKNQTVLTDANAKFKDGLLIGQIINTDISRYLQSLIVSNTENQIIICGDASVYTSINDTYKIIDYHPEYKSGSIDAVMINSNNKL